MSTFSRCCFQISCCSYRLLLLLRRRCYRARLFREGTWRFRRRRRRFRRRRIQQEAPSQPRSSSPPRCRRCRQLPTPAAEPREAQSNRGSESQKISLSQQHDERGNAPVPDEKESSRENCGGKQRREPHRPRFASWRFAERMISQPVSVALFSVDHRFEKDRGEMKHAGRPELPAPTVL